MLHRECWWKSVAFYIKQVTFLEDAVVVSLTLLIVKCTKSE